MWYLPPYSPDLNPIEEALSKAKARTLQALFEATGRALSAVDAEDARGFFRHCGYPMPQSH